MNSVLSTSSRILIQCKQMFGEAAAEETLTHSLHPKTEQYNNKHTSYTNTAAAEPPSADAASCVYLCLYFYLCEDQCELQTE